jgi:hypothetical protein
MKLGPRRWALPPLLGLAQVGEGRPDAVAALVSVEGRLHLRLPVELRPAAKADGPGSTSHHL